MPTDENLNAPFRPLNEDSMKTLFYLQMILIDINYGHFVFTGASGEKSEFKAKLEKNSKKHDETETQRPRVWTPDTGRPEAKAIQTNLAYCLQPRRRTGRLVLEDWKEHQWRFRQGFFVHISP